MTAVGPEMTICIPTFNMGRWIAGCVESALAVRYADEVEIVVVDNSSTDDTAEVLGRYAAERHLRVVRATEHLDMIGNFNRAARAARGRWLTMLSADDVLLPSYYQAMRDELRRTEVAAVSQTASAEWGDDVWYFGPRTPHDFDVDELGESLGGVVCISTTAFRRDLFDAVGGFDPQSGLLFDFDFFFRIAHRSGLPIRALGVEGGAYFPFRGSSWQDLEATGEATELIRRWITLRSGELGLAGVPTAERVLAKRALGMGTRKLAAGEREAARREFDVAVALSRGGMHWASRGARSATHLSPALARVVLAARGRLRARTRRAVSIGG